MKHYVCIQGVCPKMYTFLIANISTFKMYYKKCHKYSNYLKFAYTISGNIFLSIFMDIYIDLDIQREV